MTSRPKQPTDQSKVTDASLNKSQSDVKYPAESGELREQLNDIVGGNHFHLADELRFIPERCSYCKQVQRLDQLFASRLRTVLDELLADGPKNVYTLEEVAGMNQHLDSRTQQSALDKSAGILETNDQWRSLIVQKRGEL